MIKIEAISLKKAYEEAASRLECSVTELHVEIIQSESSGLFGLFKKSAIIVATKKVLQEQKKSDTKESAQQEPPSAVATHAKEVAEPPHARSSFASKEQSTQTPHAKTAPHAKSDYEQPNELLLATSFVSEQEDEDEETLLLKESIQEIAQKVSLEINQLFSTMCFTIDPIQVTPYDATTLLVEFSGEDAALMIGKEGYRYKALSYMLFNWLNSKYQVGLRLEIAEFLKNQEEAVFRYLESVCESVERDGRAQTKVLDGVLIQIALHELRNRFTDKYVAIRTTRDGLKYIIINDYHAH